MDLAEQYRSFISWQCRLRKLAMRERDGRPSEGMSAGIHAVTGGDEQARINFLINRVNSADRTSEFRHIIRKTHDSSQWVKNGLRILAELHYHETDQFMNELTALFSDDSSIAYALLKAGQCKLRFAEGSIEPARMAFERIVRHARLLGHPDNELTWRGWYGVGRCDLAMGWREAALVAFRRALEVQRRAGLRTELRQSRATWFADRRKIIEDTLALLLGAGEAWAAFEIASEAEAQVLRGVEARLRVARTDSSKSDSTRPANSRDTRVSCANDLTTLMPTIDSSALAVTVPSRC